MNPDPDGDGTVEVSVERPVAGGVMLGRRGDRRVVLVEGGLPGEVVRVALVPGRKVLRGQAVAIDGAPAPERVAPPCRHVADGCGGCDWQHIRPDAQPALKREVVVDALARLGRIADPRVDLAPALAATGYRTTVHAHVGEDGRLGYFAARSHDVVSVRSCLVAHPLVDEVLSVGRFPGASSVTIRASVASGRRLAIVDGPAAPVEVPPGVEVVTLAEVRGGRRAWIEEDIGGVHLRVSARSFFQARPDGAALLVATARDLLAPWLAPDAHLVDLYCGVGLFAASLARSVGSVTGVEWSSSSARDAVHNLPGDTARVVACDVSAWTAEPADLVVADPAREGLRAGVGVIAATGCAALALVSCDAASLGRDAADLAKAGYRFERAVVVDLFPHTHHIEVVSLFTRLG